MINTMKELKQSKGLEREKERLCVCVGGVLYMYFYCIIEDDFDRERTVRGKNLGEMSE